MFRFAELLIIFFMLYLIVNILRYALVKLGGSDKAGESWIFGLSNSWFDAVKKKRQGGEKKEDQTK